jgi:MarR family transcriptional regulator, temperature-dependent positive regulator of motility
MARRDTPPTTPPRPAAAVAASPIPDSGITLQAEPGHLIRRAHQLAVSTFHETHGRQITPVQYAILRALQDTPGIDQVTLADKVALDTSTTADIATRLEAKGWIVRELLPRRQRALHLTPEGTAVLADMLPRVVPMYRQLLAPLAPAEQAEFLRLLRKFVLLNEPAAPDPASDPDAGKPEA